MGDISNIFQLHKRVTELRDTLHTVPMEFRALLEREYDDSCRKLNELILEAARKKLN